MARRRMTARSIALVGAAAIVAAGCGGGDESIPPTDASATPATTPGTETVAGAPAPQATVDLDGDGVLDVDANNDGIKDPAAPTAELGATATVPDLTGGDIDGGLGSLGSSPLFEAGAISVEDFNEQESARKQTDEGAGGGLVQPGGKPAGPGGGTGGGGKPDEPATTYSGAKVYIDGIVHDVSKGAAFPKDNPVFRLLAVSAGSIEIELIAGEFTTGGGSGVVLDKGELVSMVNASEQLTYRMKFMRATEGSDGVTF